MPGAAAYPNVKLVDHPLVQHKLTILRNVATGPKQFRELVKELAMLEAYEATRGFQLAETTVTTPITETVLGLAIALASIIVMPGLFALKYRTGKSLGSASLMADSKQTLACAMLSVALLIGLGLNYWFGIWQADPGIGKGLHVLVG